MIDRDQETLWEQRVEKIRQLSDNEGYFRRVYELLPESGTLREAWERTEAEREGVGLPERYSSYESFKAGKWQQRQRIFRLIEE